MQPSSDAVIIIPTPFLVSLHFYNPVKLGRGPCFRSCFPCLYAVCLCMGSWLFSSPEIESQGHKSMLRVRVGISKNGNTVGLTSILDRESFGWLMLNAACIFYLLFVTFNYYTGSTCYFVCRVVITAFLSRFLLITVLHFTLLQCCSILICAVKYLAYFPTLITGKVDYLF